MPLPTPPFDPVSRRSVPDTISATLLFGFTTGTASAGSHQLATERNTARAVTRGYRDPSGTLHQARDDGYTHVSPYVPGMGFHFERGDPSRGTDIDDPPILVYFPNERYEPDPFDPHDPGRDEDLVLGAVEYAVDSAGPSDDPTPDIFAAEESNRNLKLSEDEGWHWTPPLNGHALHAWVQPGNPAGVFHPENPTIEERIRVGANVTQRVHPRADRRCGDGLRGQSCGDSPGILGSEWRVYRSTLPRSGVSRPR